MLVLSYAIVVYSLRVICDSLESSITDIDQRICPTAMQTVSCCRRARMSRRKSAKMPFHQREETQQLFACPVSIETVPNKI